jgi:hypothetical protein
MATEDYRRHFRTRGCATIHRNPKWGRDVRWIVYQKTERNRILHLDPKEEEKGLTEDVSSSGEKRDVLRHQALRGLPVSDEELPRASCRWPPFGVREVFGIHAS